MKEKCGRQHNKSGSGRMAVMHTQLNNEGMTLIELLVAILILSIVATAFYHGFLTAAKTNAKAKLQHKATSLAQNVMEGLKAENISDILFQFSYPVYTDIDGNQKENFDILPGFLFSGTPQNSVGAFGSYVDSPQAGETGEYIRTDDGKYALYLTNIMMENTLFDILVTLDGAPYRNDIQDGAGNLQNTSRGQNYNSEQSVLIPVMDSDYDAVVSNSQVYDREAFEAMNIMPGFNSDEVKRTITITVKDTPLLNGETISRVSALYEYFFMDTVQYSETDWVFDNTDEPTKRLRNIFLFYQPYYSESTYIDGRDTICLNNPGDRELELYVVKQQTETNIQELSRKERSYQNSVKITNSGFYPDQSYVGIHTNLGYNLADGILMPANPQAKYYLNGRLIMGEQALADVLRLGGLTNDRASDKILDVKIEVFKAGTGSFSTPDEFRSRAGVPAAVLDGSIRN